MIFIIPLQYLPIILNDLFNEWFETGTLQCNTLSTVQYTLILSCMCFLVLIERFHVMSRRPYWCSKTKKRRPYWCPKPVLLELNSIFMQKSSFVWVYQYGGLSREWKRSILINCFAVSLTCQIYVYSSLTVFVSVKQQTM